MPSDKLGKIRPVYDLIGRDADKARLLKVFKEAGAGSGRVVLVPGHSGIGKTSLVHWLETPVAKDNGIFVTGKFNQYHQNTPYYAIRQALGKLWNRIIRSDADSGSRLIDEVRWALGDLRFLLVGLVPEMGSVFDDPAGSQDSSINFIEARHRFTRVIIDFIKTVSRPEHPVVIFLDDWQWADSASLELLKGLHSSSQLGFCLIIASYRDEEVDESHPLSPAIASMNRRPLPPETVPVKRLDQDAVRQMICCALDGTVNGLDEFTRRIWEQTRGNPFHIKAFIGFLHGVGLLCFDPASRIWHWQLKEDLPGDIVAIFIRQLDRFSPKGKRLISRAACLGNFFDLSTLAVISRRRPQDCLEVMAPLIADGLLLEVDEKGASAQGPSFTFLHDRVQQAAYLLIDPEDRPSIHLEIGRLMLASLKPEELSLRLFEILEHFNIGRDLISEAPELEKMVELNMAASVKAREATAFSAMLIFNRSAFGFVRAMPGGVDRFWRSHYREALALHRNLAESEFLEGDRKRAEQIIQASLSQTCTAIERAESLNILIVQYTLLARYEDAISSGRRALSEFDISLPRDGFEHHRDDEIRKVREKLSGRAVSDLRTLPVMTDPEMLTVTKLLITLGPPCYRTYQRLWSVIVPKVINITLDFGLVPQIGYSHTAFGGLLCWVSGDYTTARAFGDVSEAVMNTTFESPSDLSVFYLMVGSSIRHWFRHMKYASEDYARAFATGRQSGNLQYAAYAFGHNMYCRFFQGMPMVDLIADTEQSLVFSRTRLNHWAIDLLEGGLSIFRTLFQSPSSGTIPMDDAAYLDRVAANKNIQVRCIYTIFKCFYHMLLGNNQRALSLAGEVSPILFTVGTQGLLPWPEYVFIRFLVLSALYDTADELNRAPWLGHMQETLKQIETWAEHCPENYSHKAFLASAELHRIENRPGKAALCYDRAIAAAQEHKFVHWEGIANERAFYFWDQLQNGALAHSYWQQAYTCYRLWGASAKLSVMEERFKKRLGAWYPAPDGRTGEAGREEEAADFTRKHVDLLRAGSRINLELKKQQSASHLAQELAEAVNRLRIESAERKQAEAELKKTMRENRRYIQQLEQKNEELDEFTYIASHDLQEPLRKMTAFSKLLVRDLGEDLNENAGKDIDYIIDAAQRMETLIQDLLELSRTGRGEIHREPVSLNRCLGEIESLLKTKLDDKGVELVTADLPEVRGDRVLISQVFQNLITNALKFNDKERPLIEITCTLDRGIPVIGVKDNGIGIRPEYTRQIFQPFKRLHGRTEYPGSGIGLAICKKVIDRHGGAIWVDSVVGSYTHFQFTLNPKEDKDADSKKTGRDSSG